MKKEEKYFYLEKIFPDTNDIISNDFESISKVKEKCLFILDTNILLIPYKTSKNSLEVFENIYKHLIKSNSLRIPARVIREFGKNRGKNLAEVYKYLSQKENSLNRLNLDITIPPILSDEEEFKKLSDLNKKHNDSIKEIKKNIKDLQKKVYDYNWNDPVSELYKEIITPEIVIEVEKKKEDIIDDLEFRILHSIAPGFKDSGKSDKGIGDLIIWQTIKEIAKKEDRDIIYVTDDSKNDWFYVEEKQTVYPRYELLYEFKKETNQNIHIVNVTEFLILFDTKKETLDEIAKQRKDIKVVDNEEWVKISHLDLKSGMEVCYTNKSQDEILEHNKGTVTNLIPHQSYDYIIELFKDFYGKNERIAGRNFNWYKQITKTAANNGSSPIDGSVRKN